MGMHHVRANADLVASKLVAVVDVNRARADDTAQKFGCAAHYDVRHLIGSVDAVTIATPPEFHAATAIPLLEMGIPCLIEKPLAMTPGDCAAIIAAAAKTKAVVAVGHVERFNPATEALMAENIPSASIRSISVKRFSPAGGRAVAVDVVSDMMIHDLDIVLALKGRELVSTAAYGALADHARATLKFADGAEAVVQSNRKADERVRELVLQTANHEYRLDFMGKAVTKRDLPSGQTANLPVHDHDALRAEIADFLTAVKTGQPPRVTPAQALSAMNAAWAILDEMRGCQA